MNALTWILKTRDIPVTCIVLRLELAIKLALRFDGWNDLANLGQ
jgi:hypothetical protein